MANFSIRAPELADEIYTSLSALPIVSPHGHVPIELLDEGEWHDPSQLFVTGDHYVVRMLGSAGVDLDSLGLGAGRESQTTQQSREIWKLFCTHFHLFTGTPTRFWILKSFSSLFGIDELPNARNADSLFDAISQELAKPSGGPLNLLTRQGVEILATTDSAETSLEAHNRVNNGGQIRVVPTFRPDSLFDISEQDWLKQLNLFEASIDVEISRYQDLILAIEKKRQDFKEAGGTATDHGLEAPLMDSLTAAQAQSIFERALRGEVDESDANLFLAHMTQESARMSVADGLVMQIHAGCVRDHDRPMANRFGPAIGGDIPIAVDWVRGTRQLLERFGNAEGFTLVLFTMDESTYARELAPIAGHYRAVKLGPPWWFHDSPNGIRRYLDSVVETAGFSNLAGFNDDTRNIATVGARHELWRRCVSGWLADQVASSAFSETEAKEIGKQLALDLALETYNLELATVGSNSNTNTHGETQ